MGIVSAPVKAVGVIYSEQRNTWWGRVAAHSRASPAKREVSNETLLRVYFFDYKIRCFNLYLQNPTAFKSMAEGDLVGIFQIDADGYAARQTGHFDLNP